MGYFSNILTDSVTRVFKTFHINTRFPPHPQLPPHDKHVTLCGQKPAAGKMLEFQCQIATQTMIMYFPRRSFSMKYRSNVMRIGRWHMWYVINRKKVHRNYLEKVEKYETEAEKLERAEEVEEVYCWRRCAPSPWWLTSWKCTRTSSTPAGGATWVVVLLLFQSGVSNWQHKGVKVIFPQKIIDCIFFEWFHPSWMWKGGRPVWAKI